MVKWAGKLWLEHSWPAWPRARNARASRQTISVTVRISALPFEKCLYYIADVWAFTLV